MYKSTTASTMGRMSIHFPTRDFFHLTLHEARTPYSSSSSIYTHTHIHTSLYSDQFQRTDLAHEEEVALGHGAVRLQEVRLEVHVEQVARHALCVCMDGLVYI